MLAVPITAVIRIRLSHIAHPLPQYIASLLVGEATDAGASEPAASDEEEAGGGGGARGRGGLVTRGMRAAVGPLTPMVTVGAERQEHEGRTRLLAQGGSASITPPLEPVADGQAVMPLARQGEGDAPTHQHAL